LLLNKYNNIILIIIYYIIYIYHNKIINLDIFETLKEISNITESERKKFNELDSIQTIIKEKEIAEKEKGKSQIERNNELDNQINTVLDNFININESLKEYKNVINNSDDVITDLNVNIINIISNINNEINEIKTNQ